MLSKDVKVRRLINRERRKQPAWRTCMQALYQQQLTRLKLQRNSQVGARSGAPGISTPSVDGLHKNLDESLRLKTRMQTITRQEFREELVMEHNSRHAQDLRFWAEIIAQGRVGRDLEDKKYSRKQRRQ